MIQTVKGSSFHTKLNLFWPKLTQKFDESAVVYYSVKLLFLSQYSQGLDFNWLEWSYY